MRRNGSQSRANIAIDCRSLLWSAAHRENSRNAGKPQSYRRGEAIALDIEVPLGPQDCGVSGRRDPSAGGLDACRKLLDALPSVNGMAFMIVQHLDPSHDSMMVDSLCGPYLDGSLAGDRRNGDRMRARLCHSAWRRSVGRRQGRVADFEAGGSTRRAASLRLPFEFPGSRRWSARDLRGPFR